MSYRQGQLDALYKLGLFKSPGQAVLAHGGIGAALGAAGGAWAAPEGSGGTGAIVGGLAGGALGGGGKLTLNEIRDTLKRVANKDFRDVRRDFYRARDKLHGPLTLPEEQALEQALQSLDNLNQKTHDYKNKVTARNKGWF